MNNLEERNERLQIVESPESTEVKEGEPSASGMSGDRPQKRSGRRAGRRSVKMDVRAKLERSRQSARECRARKKLRYQYLEDLVANREKAVFALRDELEMYKEWCSQLDIGLMPLTLLKITEEIDKSEPEAANQKEENQKSNQQKSSTNQILGNTEVVVAVTSNQNEEKSNQQTASTSQIQDNTESVQRADLSSRYLTKENTVMDGDKTRGNNSKSGFLIKGHNSDFDHDTSGSSADGNSWDFIVDDDYVKVVPDNNYSITTSTCTLPTILEEQES